MAYTAPQGDFVTTTLGGAINATATTATIGTGLHLPATNGILHLDYNSAIAVGTDYGPETITYATYTSGTGALTGLTRGEANTDNGTAGQGVAHASGAKVSCGPSALYYQQSPQFDTWNSAGTLTYASADSPTFTATITGDSTASIYPGVRVKGNQDQALSHYWTFDSSSAADVGAATMADIGTPTYAAGKFSNALTLNGSNQALSITDHADFKLGLNGAEFTIGAWFKTSNAGAGKYIFQSYSDNTNANGVKLVVASTNVLSIKVGNNAASDSTSIDGTTTVTDGNWHYVVWSFRNNYSQLYLDGRLEASGYSVTPTYAATNYVRIGCANDAGSNATWFNGQIDDLFLINGYALDEQTIKAKYDADEAQGTADITLTKYFLCTKSVYSAPNTTVTLYGGTDHALVNSAITSAYYSSQKAPYGFPLGANKWTFEYSSAGSSTTATPTAGTWYNHKSLSVPIGSWKISYNNFIGITDASAGSWTVYQTISLANNSESWLESSTANTLYIPAGGVANTQTTSETLKKFESATTVYLNYKTSTSGLDSLSSGGATIPTVIRATSTLL